MRGPTRRSVLLGGTAALLLAACGDDGGDGGEGDAGGDRGSDGSGTGAAGAYVLGTAFDPNALLVAGIEQRAPFLLFEPSGGLVPADEAPDSLTFEISPPGDARMEPVTVERHGAGIDRVYYPLVTTFPQPGLHVVRTEVGGAQLEQPVIVSEPGAVGVPQVGDALPVARTPTLADPAGTATICTRDGGPCPFHEVSIDTALTEGRPVVVLWSTPAYCQVAICGPVLDVLIEEAPRFPDVAFVHLEVYPNDPPPEGRPPELFTGAFGLTYEPVLFVADAGGTVTARLDNVYDTTELAAALATIAG